VSDRPTTEPVWLTEGQVRMLHAESLRLFGGAAGVRDAGLLQSALGRPRHLWTYDESATLFDLAAAYAFGLAKNHAFVDGKKRVALLAIRAFLFRNGYRFNPDEVETVMTMEGVAGGTVSEVELTTWVEANAARR
jgi:death-on-curing protein